MSKIKLKSGQEFDLISLGYMRDETRKTMQFRFSSDLGIGEVQNIFKDTEAISAIDYILDSGTIKETFTDCVAYQSITQDAAGKYIVTLSTDVTSAKFEKITSELDIVKEESKQRIELLEAAVNDLILGGAE